MITLNNFHGDDVLPSAPQEALFHVIPAPYEKSVSYGTGTASGPHAILEASCQLELFDGRSIAAQHGIYTTLPVDCAGQDLEALQGIKQTVAHTLALDKIPIILGGEHTVTLGAIEALAKHHQHFGVVQFDAHTDLRDSYQDSPYSHACVMKRIFDKDIPFFQLGTRSYSYPEHLFRIKHNIPFLNADDIHLHGSKNFSLPENFPDKIYITFDIDGLDSAVMPGTGTPVPGGLTWQQTMGLLERITNRHTCIGCDIVEFAPIAGQHAYAYTAAQLVYNIMGFFSRSTPTQHYYQFTDEECIP